MASSVLFTGPGGSDPVAAIIQLRTALTPNASDGVFGGQMARTIIREKTARGVDVDGQSFTPYSDSYAKQKQKRGRNASPVDLFGYQAHTHMLNGMLVKSGGITSDSDSTSDSSAEPITEFRLGFYDEELATRARAHNEGTKRLPVRRFFDLTEEDARRIEAGIGSRMLARARSVL